LVNEVELNKLAGFTIHNCVTYAIEYVHVIMRG
jgi:hypothetical protein